MKKVELKKVSMHRWLELFTNTGSRLLVEIVRIKVIYFMARIKEIRIIESYRSLLSIGDR